MKAAIALVTTNGVEISGVSFDSPDGGRVTGMLFDRHDWLHEQIGLDAL